MSNANTNLQTQTSNALHNVMMKAGGKDRSPMLAPGNYVQWKSQIKRYIDTKPNNELIHYCLQNPPYKFKWTEKTVPITEGSSETTTEGYMENYKNVSQDIRNQLDAEVEAEFGKFTSQDGESLESYYSRFYKMMNELVRNQCNVTNHQVNVQFLLQLQSEWQRSQEAATRNRGKAIVNSPPPTYDQEPTMVAEDDEMSKEKEIDKLMVLISLSFKKIYKPTNNNLRTSSNTSRANQDYTLIINRGTRYDIQRAVNVARARENVAMECQKPKWAKDAAYHKEKMLLCKQEEAGIQFKREHHVQPKSVNDTYLEVQGDTNITIEPLDMNTSRETVDQDDNDIAKERDLLASLIEKLKCEINDNKHRNKLLESSNITTRRFRQSEFLKKAQRANPCLHDIGCYDDNLALMLAPESNEMILLAQESRSKLSYLIKPFDYKNLNNLYDLFVPQRENPPKQRYFSERSKLSHTAVSS
ncbi:hypothetical protein Tco_1327722 [Tanacetum coccineum]